MECHTPWRTAGTTSPTLGKGGRDSRAWGVSVSRNITSHKRRASAPGPTPRSRRAITQGKRKDGTPLKPPMGYPLYAKMTDADLDAIVAYLRTVPPKE